MCNLLNRFIHVYVKILFSFLLSVAQQMLSSGEYNYSQLHFTCEFCHSVLSHLLFVWYFVVSPHFFNTYKHGILYYLSSANVVLMKKPLLCFFFFFWLCAISDGIMKMHCHMGWSCVQSMSQSPESSYFISLTADISAGPNVSLGWLREI